MPGIKHGAKSVINFKGYLIGNGATDKRFDGNALIPFVHGMGLISDDIYEDVKAACKGKYYDSKYAACTKNLDKVYKILEGLNVYYTIDSCYHDPPATAAAAAKGNGSLPLSFQQLGTTDKALPVRKRMFGRAWPLRTHFVSSCGPHWLQIALDVMINYTFDVGSNMIPYHKKLTKELGYRALIFSGDHDMCVPFTGSEAWTRSLRYKVVDEWRPWFTDGVVAGFLQAYEHHLTFLTIKGAGHTVPEYKPREALHFYSRWLEGKRI
ncbi:Serine carboxypeptidase, histidine active site [Sesbania bispinosa]|nr:Serine carboxypeptidase, histidine active site [Sesbania bispinosa]